MPVSALLQINVWRPFTRAAFRCVSTSRIPAPVFSIPLRLPILRHSLRIHPLAPTCASLPLTLPYTHPNSASLGRLLVYQSTVMERPKEKPDSFSTCTWGPSILFLFLRLFATVPFSLPRFIMLLVMFDDLQSRLGK